jgi:hypothetical protein
MIEEIKFPIGGMWEFPEWSVLFNYVCYETFGVKPCKHCTRHSVEIVPTYGSGVRSAYTRFNWVCPRVIHVKNEGGYDSTGVCLDCVFEAKGKIDAVYEVQ